MPADRVPNADGRPGPDVAWDDRLATMTWSFALIRLETSGFLFDPRRVPAILGAARREALTQRQNVWDEGLRTGVDRALSRDQFGSTYREVAFAAWYGEPGLRPALHSVMEQVEPMLEQARDLGVRALGLSEARAGAEALLRLQEEELSGKVLALPASLGPVLWQAIRDAVTENTVGALADRAHAAAVTAVSTLPDDAASHQRIAEAARAAADVAGLPPRTVELAILESIGLVLRSEAQQLYREAQRPAFDASVSAAPEVIATHRPQTPQELHQALIAWLEKEGRDAPADSATEYHYLRSMQVAVNGLEAMFTAATLAQTFDVIATRRPTAAALPVRFRESLRELCGQEEHPTPEQLFIAAAKTVQTLPCVAAMERPAALASGAAQLTAPPRPGRRSAGLAARKSLGTFAGARGRSGEPKG